MLKKFSAAYFTAFAIGLGAISTSAAIHADGFGPMNMMNPGKWFGKKDYDDDYPPPPPGVGGPWGGPYGPPPPGPGFGAPGFGAPPPATGYGSVPDGGDVPGAPAYEYRRAPGYGGNPGYGAAPGYGGNPGYGAAPGYGGNPGYGAAPAYGGDPGYAVTPGYGAAPATGYGAPAYSSPKATQTTSGPTREEMAGRIQELEQRLEQMESQSRTDAPPLQPSTPPPPSYQYYSGDQTQQAPAYPFRPMDLGQ